MKKEAIKKLERKTRQATEQPENAPANGKTPGVHTASKEQFDKARRKTSAEHAGLFRRLAK